jgi:pimeloyl-ACP methyl ester carboxylesterase
MNHHNHCDHADYDNTRKREQLRIHDLRIGAFIQRYRPGRRTIFLFPGGMGSQLYRARAPYEPSYDRVWLGAGAFMGNALKIRMHRGPTGEHHDLGHRIIIADGLVTIAGLSLYERFSRWCEASELNLFVFAWDWRRRLEDAVEMFKHFLPTFRQRVGEAWGVDPLRDFVLLGHSYGGMIVKMLLDELDPSPSCVIAAATPFYGFGTIIRRWREGDAYLNLLGKREVIRTICSMPGCYPLAYLSPDTWEENAPAFATDPFGLSSYPSQDVQGRPIDPYRPVEGQYPLDLGFDETELAHASKVARQVSALPKRADKLICIRGIGFDTTGGITWGKSIAPRRPWVSGDSIQPAWGTRLAGLAADQCISVSGADHMFFMEHRPVQMALEGIL